MIRRLRRLAETASGTFASYRSGRHVVWNLVGGGWAGVLIVLVTPVYVSRLGLEGYGIVGLWLVMQVMTGMLDVGMGATVVKAYAGFRPEHDGPAFKRDLLRTMELLYGGVALALAITLAIASGWIATRWLTSSTLSSASIGSSLQLMAIALGLQFPSSLYTNGLAGLQAHGRMNGLQIMGNTLRYGGGVAVVLWRPDIITFFIAQAIVAGVQTFATRLVLWRMVTGPADPRPVFQVTLVRRLWRYSAGMALTAVAAVMMANADRLAISVMLPTAELGKYAVAFTATGLLQLGIQPFYRAYFPRYAELVSAGDAAALRREYFRSCRLMAMFIIPLGVVGWVFAPQLLTSWLGSYHETVAAVFRWLLVGIVCSGLMWLPAAFQQAHGWTRLHASMITGALVLGAPVMVSALRSTGTVGATTVWIIHGISGITLGLWLMHRRLLIGDLFAWYRAVLVPPLLVTIPLVGLSWWAYPASLGRWTSLLWIGTTGSLIVAGLLFGALVRLRQRAQASPASPVAPHVASTTD